MFLHRATPAEVGDVLRRLEESARRRRRVEVDDLLLVLEWADLHRLQVDPEVPGGESLREIGGDGTPRIQELALCELGIARGVHTLSARAAVADALDLRHRLPDTFDLVLALDTDLWVARKVAATSRNLSADAVRIVDRAVAKVIATQAPSRVLAVAEAKIIEADRVAHEAKVAEERSKRYVGLSRTDEHGLRTVIARVTAGDAQWVDAMVARVAEILGERPEHEGTCTDELRAIAFGWLAKPAELLELLLEHGDQGESRATAFPAELLGALRDVDPKRLRPRITLYVHLHEDVLRGVPGVARVETLGPATLTALRELLGTAEVTVKPVLDLADRVATSAYEHPTSIAERIHLIRPGDQFPHAGSMSRATDLDHAVPYDPGGPPGQTSTHTSQPLSSTGHRAKTHLDYECTPLPTGEMLWRTPHGLLRLVDDLGTTGLDESEATAWTSDDPLDRALVRLLHRVRAGAVPVSEG
ncbi:hypothetical protein BH11ACT8_BH11ACT8_36030 [soil metagenome]